MLPNCATYDAQNGLSLVDELTNHAFNFHARFHGSLLPLSVSCNVWFNLFSKFLYDQRRGRGSD